MPDKYVDAYVVPVPKSKVDEYKAFTKNISDFVEKHRALEYVDCIADDVKPGKQTSFPQAVQLGDDEIVMLSCAVFRSRERLTARVTCHAGDQLGRIEAASC